jgi:hypothetical protein
VRIARFDGAYHDIGGGAGWLVGGHGVGDI